MLVYRGEKRFLSVDLAAVLAVGDSLVSGEAVTIVQKRGRTATTMLTTPAPIITGTEVRFWVDVPLDQPRDKYVVVTGCDTANGETVVEEAPLIVQ